MIGVRTSAGLKEIASLFVRTAGGLMEIGEVWVRTASGLKQVFSAFGGSSGLSAEPPSVSGYTSSHAGQRVNTNSVTISVSPAGPVDSVSWSFADGGWDAINPTSLTTAFRSPLIGPGDSESTTATATVTRGGVPATIDVPASCFNFGT